MSDGVPPTPAYPMPWGSRPARRRGLHLPARPTRRRGVRRRWVVWLSPDDQPRWARPALLVVAALAGLAYAWGLDSAALEPFYGAAARSMSASWHDFFFGAFDPRGLVSVDKLPGALWLQALSLRAFGVNTWAFVLPQVIEGILTVLVLYRAVRRLAGAQAGIIAAVVLAASPVTVLLNRGNISDSLLILLLVLAADATSAAITTGELGSLLLAGLWVGLAFQAKMTQAWLVLPALWLAYLLASPARGRRLGHVVLATVVTAVVSLSWMAVVTAVPRHDRPYVDGSTNDSVFAQVFDYNGVFRFEHPSTFETSVGPLAPFFQVGLENRTFLNASTAVVSRSWHRLLSGPLGRDDGWLLPTALLAALAVAIARRRRHRFDPVRACCVLWGTWLVVHIAAFSDGAYLNSYYTAALSPAIAALCGVGLTAAWRASHAERAADGPALAGAGPPGVMGRLVVAAAVTGGAAYAVYLVPASTGVHGWLVPLAVAVAAVADVLLVASVLWRRGPVALGSAALVAAAVAGLLVPSVAAATVVNDRLGPFDTPFQPTAVTLVTRVDARRAEDRAVVVAGKLEQLARAQGTTMLFVTDTSAVASDYILASGREVLPIGGFTGAIPFPTLQQIRADIAFGLVRLAIVPVFPASPDPRIGWITSHCRRVSIDRPGPVRFAVYDCQGAATT